MAYEMSIEVLDASFPPGCGGRLTATARSRPLYSATWWSGDGINSPGGRSWTSTSTTRAHGSGSVGARRCRRRSTRAGPVLRIADLPGPGRCVGSARAQKATADWRGRRDGHGVSRRFGLRAGRRHPADNRRRLDGSKALAAGVRKVFGEAALVQRCTLHKRRNVTDHLPKDQQRFIDAKLAKAFANRDAAAGLPAARELAKLGHGEDEPERLVRQADLPRQPDGATVEPHRPQGVGATTPPAVDRAPMQR